jgi:hypothetical protein
VKAFLEYIAEMSESDKRRLRSLIDNLLSHRLKIRYVGGKDTSHWQTEIRAWEDSLFELIHDAAPGLKSHDIDLGQIHARLLRQRGPFPGVLRKEYPDTNFPDVCPFTLEQVVGSRVWNELRSHLSES